MELWFMLIQTLAALTAAAYFARELGFLKKRRTARDHARDRRLREMRRVSLSPPLSERARPKQASEIIGQREAIDAMRAALFGRHPQHLILYGPPGVGKTCAARLVFREARMREDSAFRKNAPFVEMDASTLRFDERGAADPLIGSVHDPIYQGAGEWGISGIPVPKEGAVTRAHGGVLFLDEIGEMSAQHMNRLLKVLEDRRVRLESAYFDPDDDSLPYYVRSAFEKGLPADFRLIAATSRSPESLPQALRSRCIEIFFQPLGHKERAAIAGNAARCAGFPLEKALALRVAESAHSGRECVNLVQLACGRAYSRRKSAPDAQDFYWALASGALSQARKGEDD